MVVRSRSRDMRLPFSGTYWSSILGTKYRTVFIGLRDDCDDTVGERETDNPFQMRRRYMSTFRINGQLLDAKGRKVREFVNYPITFDPSAGDSHAYWGDMDHTTVALAAITRTNPSVPHISVPTFLGELKDLPGTVRGFWQHFRNLPTILYWKHRAYLRLVAEGHVTWRWVLRPMKQDLFSMLGFMEAARRRFEYLKRLSEGKFVTKRVNLRREEHYTPWAPWPYPINSDGALLYANHRRRYLTEDWATVRWHTQAYLDLPTTDQELWKLSWKIVTGFTSWEALAAGWELLPFSWFADWFSKVGSFIRAHQNAANCYASGICYMQHTQQDDEWLLTGKPGWVSVTGYLETKDDQKRRTPLPYPIVTDALLPKLPWLTSGQLSILGSLWTLGRVPRRTGLANIANRMYPGLNWGLHGRAIPGGDY